MTRRSAKPSAPPVTAQPVHPLPQSGGSYVLEAEGTLTKTTAKKEAD